jgi:hypothetical protein
MNMTARSRRKNRHINNMNASSQNQGQFKNTIL